MSILQWFRHIKQSEKSDGSVDDVESGLQLDQATVGKEEDFVVLKNTDWCEEGEGSSVGHSGDASTAEDAINTTQDSGKRSFCW